MPLTGNPRPALYRSVLVWAGITTGCALPLLILSWQRSGRGEKTGMLMGVLAWTLLAALLDERLRATEPPWASRILRDGAIGVMLVQAVGAAIFREWFLFFFYAPAIVAMSKLLRLPDDMSGLTGHFALTLVCGLQAALVAYLTGWALTAFRRRR